ncbi:MAG: DUF3795 domain-containing protein [Clostridia bacterium]|nr:DUF3795 domain-containing protein [Clostridia bacterium]
MDPQYMCYCGLYCENCAVKAKIVPAAKALYDEMKAAEFEEIIQFIPGGDAFWPFLKDLAINGTCASCREGSGNPGCAIRICAQGKGIDICALCESYPCALFDAFFAGYPILERDNALLRDEGLEAWAKLQDERRASGFVYQHKKA